MYRSRLRRINPYVGGRGGALNFTHGGRGGALNFTHGGRLTPEMALKVLQLADNRLVEGRGLDGGVFPFLGAALATAAPFLLKGLAAAGTAAAGVAGAKLANKALGGGIGDWLAPFIPTSSPIGPILRAVGGGVKPPGYYQHSRSPASATLYPSTLYVDQNPYYQPWNSQNDLEGVGLRDKIRAALGALKGFAGKTGSFLKEGGRKFLHASLPAAKDTLKTALANLISKGGNRLTEKLQSINTAHKLGFLKDPALAAAKSAQEALSSAADTGIESGAAKILSRLAKAEQQRETSAIIKRMAAKRKAPVENTKSDDVFENMPPAPEGRGFSRPQKDRKLQMLIHSLRSYSAN